MKKKGAVSLSTKVIIGLVLGIPIVIVILLVGVKVLSLILPAEEEGNFDKLIEKIRGLGEEKKTTFLYYIDSKHTLVGFNKGQKEIFTGTIAELPKLPVHKGAKFLYPVGRPNSCDINFVCLCLCEHPTSPLIACGDLKEAKCVSNVFKEKGIEEIEEGIVLVYENKIKKDETGPILIEGKQGGLPLTLEKKGNILRIS